MSVEGLLPEVEHLLAHQRPAGHRVGRRWNAEAAAVENGFRMVDRFGHSDAQQIGRHEDDDKRDEDDQRGDQPTLVGNVRWSLT